MAASVWTLSDEITVVVVGGDGMAIKQVKSAWPFCGRRLRIQLGWPLLRLIPIGISLRRRGRFFVDPPGPTDRWRTSRRPPGQRKRLRIGFNPIAKLLL